jgi:hypothetical protein
MTEPTERMLRLFDEHGAKLTIMADVGEILKFKEYAETHPKDDFHYGEIVAQLQDAVTRGHDVQLHIHSSYFNATHNGNHWVQDWTEYDFANLNLDRMRMMVKEGKEFLEGILKPVSPAYRCIAFRAANWSVSPARNVVKVLLENGIEIDTSIFKYGRRNDLVKFNYTDAHSEIIPWRAGGDDLCIKDNQSRLWEFPIYSENRWLGAFLTVNRVYRVRQGARHRVARSASGSANGPAAPARHLGLTGRLSLLTKKHAWKADFNQCTGRQLIRALLRAERKSPLTSKDVPFVLIGHSKLFTPQNERSLRPFLEFIAQNGKRFGFGTFGFFHDKIESQMSQAARGLSELVPAVDARPSK